jgi:2-polyprenyl-3-methyl-5-hydroxy-6-metoxy-1,4-benzoquinol methylase
VGPTSQFRPLHEINRCLAHIERLAGDWRGRVVDVGCGSGILAGALAARAQVTGIDLATSRSGRDAAPPRSGQLGRYRLFPPTLADERARR